MRNPHIVDGDEFPRFITNGANQQNSGTLFCLLYPITKKAVLIQKYSTKKRGELENEDGRSVESSVKIHTLVSSSGKIDFDVLPT